MDAMELKSMVEATRYRAAVLPYKDWVLWYGSFRGDCKYQWLGESWETVYEVVAHYSFLGMRFDTSINLDNKADPLYFGIIPSVSDGGYIKGIPNCS